MLHLYSKGCEYAIQAISHITLEERRKGFSLRPLCKRAGLPESFTRKVFQTLVKNRLLTAKRGPGGGYRFRKDPRKISLLSVIYAIDGKGAFDQCVVKDEKCCQAVSCSLHPMWFTTRENLIRELKKNTVAELIEEGV